MQADVRHPLMEGSQACATGARHVPEVEQAQQRLPEMNWLVHPSERLLSLRVNSCQICGVRLILCGHKKGLQIHCLGPRGVCNAH